MSSVTFLLLSLLAFCTVRADDEWVDVVKGLPINGWGTGQYKVADGHESTGFVGDESTFPLAFIDLKGVYEINEITLYSQYRQVVSQGVNEPFNVYTWDQHTAHCSIEKHHPWHLCAKGVTFTAHRQKLTISCPQEASEAQYIIFTRGSPNCLEVVRGLVIYEISVLGKKIRDNEFSLPSFEDNPMEDHYEVTKKAILKGLEHPRGLGSKVHFDVNRDHRDVPVILQNSYYVAIAGVRDRGRVMLISGQRFWVRLDKVKKEPELMDNMREWLTDGSPTAPVLSVNDPYEENDLLAISCSDTFDVSEVVRKIRDGENPAFLIINDACIDNPDLPFTSLLSELEINYRILSDPHPDFYSYTSNTMKSQIGHSYEYYFELAMKSWHRFRTVDSFRGFTEMPTKLVEGLSDPKAQAALQEVIEHYRAYFEELAPCDLTPLTLDDETRMAFINYNNLHFGQLGETITTLPGVERVPGVVSHLRVAETVQVTLTTEQASNFQPLGVYASPGQAFSWKVIESNVEMSKIRMRVNCMTDVLSKVEKTNRWPTVAHSREMLQSGRWASPTGGPIYLDLPADSHVVIEIEGAYRYPWVDARDPSSLDNWEENKLKYGGVPRIHISGDIFHACLPWHKVVHVSREDLEFGMTYHDNMVKIMHNYRGSDWKQEPNEILCVDVTITIGFGHSGRPIMGTYAWVDFYTDRSKIIPKDFIGIIHEVGHNLQTPGTKLLNGLETTNNVFVPVVQGHLFNVDMFELYNSYKFNQKEIGQLVERMDQEEFEGFIITYYIYVGHVFGEGLIGNTWRHMNSQENAPKQPHESIQNYLVTLSKKAGYNLIPFNRLWRVPVDEETKAEVDHLECFIPEDAVTASNPDAVERVLEEYGRECYRGPIEKVTPEVDYEDGCYTNRPKTIYVK